MKWLLIVISSLAFSVYAKVPNKQQTELELQHALSINHQYVSRELSRGRAPAGARPVPETATFKYLLIEGSLDNDRLEMHEKISRNLPAGMILVVVTEKNDAADVQNRFLQWIPKNRLVVASGSNLGDLTWSRDSYPYPVYMDGQNTVELVAHEYFRYFKAQNLIGQSVNAKNVNHQKFIYVGGNLIGTEDGDCFNINSDRDFNLSDDIFKNIFYCKTLTRLPHEAGIGDVDEVIKPLPNKIMLTTEASYRSTLTALGYKVVMLPKAPDMRTYANSVILGQLVFMPSFQTPQDAEAQKIYESFGYKVVQIDSRKFSDNWYGSLHCLTMAYPDMDLKYLLNSLGLEQN